MSMEYTRPDGANSVTDSEGVMFAAQPIWDRNRKRRPGLGRKTAASAPMATEASAIHEPADAPARARKSAQRSSTAPVALTAGVAGLVALGAAGWFMTRDGGIPEIAPSDTAALEVATAPIAPAPLPPMAPAAADIATPAISPPEMAPPAVNDPVPARPAPVARTRPAAPAAAPSVNESGLDASASSVLPDGPQPYTTLNPDSVAAPPPVEDAAPPIPQTPPVQAEPVPQPVNPVNPADPTPTPDVTPPL
ncbi:hypothetical protein [Phenylobacterium sp.]|uniref:hypothetical protein n=1 Tax=Phenylobacterium sp. TaxID=1871053 RepID=UPI00301DC3FC